jgi:membrane-associated phospholipid phosphatase
VLCFIIGTVRPGRFDRRRIGVVLLVIALGPGIAVPALKVVFERPRPSQIERFGGRDAFVPLLRIGPDCADGCRSFPSGDTAAAFALVAVALAADSRLGMAAALVVGSLVAASRVAAGRHFLSDVLVTGLATTFLVLLLFRLLVPRTPPGRISADMREPS